MKINDLKIGTRLTSSYILMLLMLAVVAVTGLTSLSNLRESMENITKGNDAESTSALDMRITVDDRSIALRNMVLETDPAEVQRQADRLKKQADNYDVAFATLRTTFKKYGIRADEQKMLDEISAASKVAMPLIEQVHGLVMTGDKAEATRILLSDLRTASRAWTAKLESLVECERLQNEEALSLADASYKTARFATFGLSVAALICGLVLAYVITKGITKPIDVAVRVAQSVAAGDLTSHIRITSRDETGILLTALGEMNTSLKTIVTKVRSGTDAMSISSREIAEGNMDLSSRTEDQASSLEETASSMEEITATVRQNAENAGQGNKLAAAAKEAATKGGIVIADVVTTMEDINTSSKKISEIVAVIDSIAFQTNILALNAAVEAARAGEQGRGFAVVASEVRNLAQRSAVAAKEIKVMIDESVGKVDAGSQLVDQAGKTMEEVVLSVDRVTAIMAEITTASQEQSAGIEQINQAIIAMDNVTQQNSALVEEAAATAQSLQDEAVHLAQIVSTFMLPSPHTKSPQEFNERRVSIPIALAL